MPTDPAQEPHFLDRFQEVQELDRLVLRTARSGDLTSTDAQRREQRRRTVPHVVVSASLLLGKGHRQQRLRPV